MIAAGEAIVSETWQTACSKITPSCASESIAGVVSMVAPYAPTWSARTVSTVMSSTFVLRAGLATILRTGFCWALATEYAISAKATSLRRVINVVVLMPVAVRGHALRRRALHRLAQHRRAPKRDGPVDRREVIPRPYSMPAWLS